MDDKTPHLPQQVPIDAYGNGGFRFGGMSHVGDLLSVPTGMHAWSAPDILKLDEDDIAPILAHAGTLEVFFWGTGLQLVRPKDEIFAAFAEAQIIFDVMSTGSAARTYNIMIGEQRAVGAALMAVHDAK